MQTFGVGKPRSGCVRLVALALASVVSTCGFGAFGAGSATALGEQCSGANVLGVGGFLQQGATFVWKEDFNSSPDPLACNGSQGSGGTPNIFYSPQSSGGGLNAWGAFDGIFHDKTAKFIAVDEPPVGLVKEEGTQLNRMTSAIGSDVAVIPVTQTAISIVAHPPSLPAHPSCAVSRITGAEVESVFSGQLTNWRQLKAASNRKAGGDCDQAITRIVREEDSGTTYQFKHYLDQVNPEPLTCSGEAPRTWEQLQPSSGEATSPNRDWPRPADCQKGEGPVTVVATSGEGAFGPLEFMVGQAGTITYAGLPEAESAAPKFILDVHNGVKAASPSNKENDANCAAATYELPSGWESGINVDWSRVYGSNPKIGEVKANAYPICTLSWAVAATDSAGVFGSKAATTVRNYLDYVNATEVGKSGRHGHWYRGVPGPVAKAAGAAIAQIGGEEKEEETSTVLCQVEPEEAAGTLICPKGQTYKGEVRGALKPKTVTTFESTSGPPGTITCSEASLVGEFNENGTSPLEGGVSVFTFGSGGGACPSTLESPKEAEMEVALVNTPFDASKFTFLSPTAPQASFVLARSDAADPQLAFFGSGTKCHYDLVSQSGQVVNGPPAGLTLAASWALEFGTENCPATLQQAAELNLDRGKSEADLFVAGG